MTSRLTDLLRRNLATIVLISLGVAICAAIISHYSPPPRPQRPCPPGYHFENTEMNGRDSAICFRPAR